MNVPSKAPSRPATNGRLRTVWLSPVCRGKLPFGRVPCSAALDQSRSFRASRANGSSYDKDDDPNGLMVGRCIHLDTRAALGTRLREARLQDRPRHQRLSRRASPERTDDSLQDRELRDATHRTQLYRIEDVLFLALFGFSGMFLSSRVLLGEWLADLGFVA
jgi:hypothetical protein